MLAWLSGVQFWIYGALAAVILGFVALFIYRGHEIDALTAQVSAARAAAAQAQGNLNAVTALRAQEIQTQQKAQARADEIRKTPKSQDGPVAPVLRDSLSRL